MKKNNYKIIIATQLLQMRFIQLLINEKYKNKSFKIPIHLALGHEAIAVAAGNALFAEDRMILSHRNIHYNIARGASLVDLVNEYSLNKNGLSSGKQGSMNLSNKNKNILYTSSILGNNLGVGAGVALGLKSKGKNNIVFIVTGDGAMEEGSFYETLLVLASHKLPSIIIIENNGWSLGSTIQERRCEINVEFLAKSVGGTYTKLQNNDVFDYIDKIKKLRKVALNTKGPVVIEVMLTSLGDWKLKSDENPKGKFINYHAGPAPTIDIFNWPYIKKNKKDPIYALKEIVESIDLKEVSSVVELELRKL